MSLGVGAEKYEIERDIKDTQESTAVKKVRIEEARQRVETLERFLKETQQKENDLTQSLAALQARIAEIQGAIKGSEQKISTEQAALGASNERIPPLQNLQLPMTIQFWHKPSNEKRKNKYAYNTIYKHFTLFPAAAALL